MTGPEVHLENLLRAMAKIAAESAKAVEAMSGFLEAHEQSQTQGVGVVVVRKADGSVTSTPNVFVPAGTAVFMDEPGPFVSPPVLFELPQEVIHHVRAGQVHGYSIDPTRILA